MAYEPTVWKANDVITSAKLNKLEQGVAGGGLVKIGVTISTNGMESQVATLQKTAQELLDYIAAGCLPYIDEEFYGYRQIVMLSSAEIIDEGICFNFGSNFNFECSSLSGYPASGGNK